MVSRALAFAAGFLLLAGPAVLAQDIDITNELKNCDHIPGCVTAKTLAEKYDTIREYLKRKSEPSPKQEILTHDADVAAEAKRDAEQQKKENADAEKRLRKYELTPEQLKAELVSDDARITDAMNRDCKDPAFANGARWDFCQQQLTDLNLLEERAKRAKIPLTSPIAAERAGYSRNGENRWAGESHGTLPALQTASPQPIPPAQSSEIDWNALAKPCVDEFGKAPGWQARANKALNAMAGPNDLNTPGQVQDKLNGIKALGTAGLTADQILEQKFTVCVYRERLRQLGIIAEDEVLKRSGNTGTDLMKGPLEQAELWEAGRPAREAKAKADQEAAERALAQLQAQQEAERRRALAQPLPVAPAQSSGGGNTARAPERGCSLSDAAFGRCGSGSIYAASPNPPARAPVVAASCVGSAEYCYGIENNCTPSRASGCWPPVGWKPRQ